MISPDQLWLVRQYQNFLIRKGFDSVAAEKIAIIAIRYSLTPEAFL